MKENIDALAREYAEKFCDNLTYKEETAERDKLTDIRNISETASNFLQWLLISHCMVKRNGDKETIDEINALIIGIQPNEGQVSDGYHTFDELYDFRRAYNAALVNTHKYPCVKSYRHSDGELCFGGGWFVIQMQLPTGQISNHYENKYWDEFDCEIRERADEWDGHTDKDVLERLIKLRFISEEEVRKREEELDKEAQEWFRHTISKEEAIKELNPNEHKISIPLPEDAKWEAIGRGYASVLMDKQARIDRLERLIWMLHENICKDVKSNVLFDDDLETSLCSQILEKVEQLKTKQ